MSETPDGAKFSVTELSDLLDSEAEAYRRDIQNLVAKLNQSLRASEQLQRQVDALTNRLRDLERRISEDDAKWTRSLFVR